MEWCTQGVKPHLKDTWTEQPVTGTHRVSRVHQSATLQIRPLVTDVDQWRTVDHSGPHLWTNHVSVRACLRVVESARLLFLDDNRWRDPIGTFDAVYIIIERLETERTLEEDCVVSEFSGNRTAGKMHLIIDGHAWPDALSEGRSTVQSNATGWDV